MTGVDYWVVVGYVVLMASVGLLVKSYSSDISDYFRAGCKGTWWLVGASVFMQGFSALVFTGISGQAYLGGWSVMTIFWSNALIYFVHAAFFAPWLRQTRAITPGDAVRQRFGAYTEQIFVYYSTVGGLIWGGVLLLALATFTSVVFGMSLFSVILVTGVVVVFYSVIGGSWSVFTTDYLQAMILFPVTVAVAGLCLYQIGGVGNLLHEISAQGLSADFAWIKPAGHEYTTELSVGKGLFTWPWTLAMIFNGLLTAFNMTGCYRYLSVKTGREAQKAALLAGGLMILGSFIWFVPPVVGRLLYSDAIQAVTGIGNPADAVYAVVAMKVLPAGMIGLVVVAMFSASMSTMDSALTGTAALVVKNIFPPLQRRFGWRERSQPELLKMSRGVNLCLGTLVIGLALWIDKLGGDSGMFNIMLQILVLVAAPMSLPFACALFIRRVPKWAAVFSMATGLTASVAMTVATKGYGVEILWAQKILIMALATVPPFFLTFFFRSSSPPVFYQQVDAFFDQIFTPVDYAREVGESTDLSQLRLVGRLGLVAGLMVSLLVWAADTGPHRIAVLFVALFVVLLSGLMLVAAARGGRSKEEAQ